MKTIKLPQLRIRRKKLRASTARRSIGMGPEMEYEEMSEPNMKLSRALLIVLVLHVVAVAGIIAFNTIKTRQASSSPPASRPEAAPVAQTSVAKTESPAVASLPGAIPVRRAETKAASAGTKAPPDSVSADPGKTYVVAKGDNPVAIAKKFKVSYDDLLALNQIDDPHKLQIGQKLLIPRAPRAKKAGE